MTDQPKQPEPSLEFEAQDTILLEVRDQNVFTDAKGNPRQISSETKQIAGFEWRFAVILAARKENDRYNMLDLEVYCNEKCLNDKLWSVKVQLSTFKSFFWATFETTEVRNEYGTFYGFNTLHWMFPRAIETNNERLSEIKLRIKVIYTMAEESLPRLDTSLRIKTGSESVTLAVNKQYLAILSKYFRCLFFGDWKEQRNENGESKSDDEKGYEITDDEEDFDIMAFKWMLYSSMTMGPMVSESNFLNDAIVVKILKLAVKYDFPALVKYCTKFLASSNLSKMVSLCLADTYNLEQLKEQCLDQICFWDFIEDFHQSVDICSQLNTDTRERLDQKIATIGVCTKEELANLACKIKYTGSLNEQDKKGLVGPYNKLVKTLMGKQANNTL